jgi:Raf kinase inhibitor-like YbhB/YbcL family protein
MSNRFGTLMLAIGLTTAIILASSCRTESADKPAAGKADSKMSINLTSTAFKHEGMIPSQYTCDGLDISPQLAWSNVPEGTKSFALICDDPDAPVGDWVHWVLYNIPPATREIAEKITNAEKLPSGALHGKTDFNRYGYGGPCPPGGTHRYFFKLYALDSTLTFKEAATKKTLLEAMKGHILGQAELMGKYKRK